MFYYTQWNYTSTDAASFARLERRRRFVLGKLLNLVPPSQLQAHDTLTTYLRQRNFSEDYVAVHSRGMDGECTWRVGPNLTDDECSMHPSYIQDLLRPHYANLSNIPIVVISDMQMIQTLLRLKQDPELGPNVIIAALDLPDIKRSLVSDMMMAVKSKVFIGPRVSSMTVIIGQMRVALGADTQTNKVFVRESTSASVASGAEKYEVCGDCIFYCNSTTSNICGFKAIYA